jgi:hypothetical protein
MNKLSARLKDLKLDISKRFIRPNRDPPPLPEDIIDIILSYRFPDIQFDSPELFFHDLYRSDEHWKALISPLCLISRTWLAPARRILYRSITEAYNDEIHGPMLWETIQKYPHVRNYIRRMFLRSPFAASHFSRHYYSPSPLHHSSRSPVIRYQGYEFTLRF